MGEETSHPGVAERTELAGVAPRGQLESYFGETAKAVLVALAGNPNLGEHDLLRLLERKDLPQEVVRKLAEHPQAERSHQVKLALVRHPKTPRLLSLPLLKYLYLFDLVGVCQTPAVPGEVKIAAEETILKKLEALPRGEKITLARRGSGRVAAALLVTSDAELIRAALSNAYLSESHLSRILTLKRIPGVLVEMISQHERWSRAYHLRLALIRNPLTPFSRVLAFLPEISVNDLRDICLDPTMPDRVRKYISSMLEARVNKDAGRGAAAGQNQHK